MDTIKPFKVVIMMLFFCVVLVTSVSVQSAVPWPIPEGLNSVEVNGYPLAYQDIGSGPPIVLIHGSLTDYRTWRKQIPVFSASYRTIAVCLRHHYPEKWNGSGNDFSVAQHASDVAALIQKLDLGTVHLLGHSRGGPVAFIVAKMHPELIRTIILEDGNIDSILPETPEKQNRMAAWRARAKTARANLEAGNPEKAAQEWLDDYSGSGRWEKLPPPVKAIIIDNVWSTTDTGERGDISCDDILKFTFPIFLLTGEKSPKQYDDIYKELRKCNPDLTEPLVVPNGPHFMHGVNPEFYNAAVLDFLKVH